MATLFHRHYPNNESLGFSLEKTNYPRNNTTQLILPPLPIEIPQQLLPDLSLTHWATKDIKHIQYLFQGINLMTFPQLQKKFNLPTTELFTYLRVKHCISHITTPLYTLPPKIWTYLTKSQVKMRGISLFYNTFHQKRVCIKSNSHLHWGNRLGTQLL